MSQPGGLHSGAPVAQEPNRSPTPFGMESLTYPVFAATDRRLLVLPVVIIVVLEARVLTEDLGGGFRKFIQVENQVPLVFAETLSRYGFGRVPRASPVSDRLVRTSCQSTGRISR